MLALAERQIALLEGCLSSPQASLGLCSPLGPSPGPRVAPILLPSRPLGWRWSCRPKPIEPHVAPVTLALSIEKPNARVTGASWLGRAGRVPPDRRHSCA